MSLYSAQDIAIILTAIGTLAAGIIAAYTEARRVGSEAEIEFRLLRDELEDVQAALKASQADRDKLRETLEHQTQALTDQSHRLTSTITALTKMTLERDELARHVRVLTEENEALKRENAALHRRIDDLERAAVLSTPKEG